MEFIVSLISALCVRNKKLLSRVQNDDWLQGWYSFINELSLPDLLLRLLLILVPVLLMGWLFEWIQHDWLGLFELLFALFAVAYSLGRFEFDAVLANYLNSLRNNDVQAARLGLGAIGDDADDLVSMQYEVEYELAYNEFQRWFPIVFWFFVAGPVAAVAYRIISWLEARDDAWEPVLGLVEWVPARLTGLSLALVGNFDDFVSSWDEVLEHGLDTRASLHAFVGSSLDSELQPAEAVERAEEQLALFKRALVLWIVVAAVLVLFT